MWAAIGRQLQRPSGLGGFLTGRVMDVFNRRSNRLAIEALRPAANDIILDLGCGSGKAIHTLTALRPTALILGIDHSAAMIADAARRNRQAISKGRVGLLCGDFSALPYRDNSIDKILAVHILYFADVAAMCEAHRVLRPGGSMALVVSEKATMEKWRFASEATHQLFDQQALVARLRRAGFKEDQVAAGPVRQNARVRGILAVAIKTISESPTNDQQNPSIQLHNPKNLT
jgi:ubiquinone/menaquinone biosynthesis C-methylase UbiE